MNVSLRQIRYFIATAEFGQVSLAAVELSISQSAITAAIKELEGTLGVPLFSRNARGMILTEAGRLFLAHSYEIMAKVDEATRLDVLPSVVEGTLNVAATYTVMGYFLPFHIGRMQRLFPNLALNLFELGREDIEKGILSGRFDIGVLLTSNVTNPSIATETLLRSERRLWVAAEHPLLSRTSVSLRDIAHEPYIMLTVDEAEDSALKYWQPVPERPQVRLRTSSVEAVRSLVGNGQGVTILSDMVHRPWSLEGRRIYTITPSDPVSSMNVGLALPADGVVTPQIEALRNYFRQFYRLSDPVRMQRPL
ncbi:MAG: LysR family transcriptional regulator [Pararhodobacter sp.]|nr:LysR family transcriptional regulator [Pararhodobacter sp.]